jgi:hypothetical protein
MHQFFKFIYFGVTLYMFRDGLSVHHQEFKTVHTASSICQTDSADSADRLLASSQQSLFDIYLGKQSAEPV